MPKKCLLFIFSLCSIMSIESFSGDYVWSKSSPASGQFTWKGCSISQDGSRFAACAWNDYVYTSSNAGANWSRVTPAGDKVLKGWTSVSASDDGMIIGACAWNDYVYISADGGATWSKKTPAGSGVVKGWTSISLDQDGSFISACAWNDYVYVSADGGTTWSKKTPAGTGIVKGWNELSIDDDGSVIVAGAWNDYVYISKDSGATWSKKTPAGSTAKGWNSLDANTDGTVIACVAYNDYLYLSADGGTSWSKKTPAGSTAKGWTSSSLSSDGTVIAVSAANDFVYTSKDSGTTWEKNSPSGSSTGLNWQCLSMSSTGTRLLACVQGSYVYAAVSSNIGWSVVFEAGEGGSIGNDPEQSILNGASCVPVTAVADAGWHFVDWSGSMSSTDNPITVSNVTSNMKLLANFAADTNSGNSLLRSKIDVSASHQEKFSCGEPGSDLLCHDRFAVRASFLLPDDFEVSKIGNDSNVSFSFGSWSSETFSLVEAYEIRRNTNSFSTNFLRKKGDCIGKRSIEETIKLKISGKKLLIAISSKRVSVKGDNAGKIFDIDRGVLDSSFTLPLLKGFVKIGDHEYRISDDDAVPCKVRANEKFSGCERLLFWTAKGSGRAK